MKDLNQAYPLGSEHLRQVFYGTAMKSRVVVFSVLLSGCVATGAQVNTAPREPAQSKLVEFVANQKSTVVELACSPATERAGESLVWVKRCNELAFSYLHEQQKNGIDFQRPITEKPFGMAADFVAKMLLANPSNFQTVSLGQTYKVSQNKT